MWTTKRAGPTFLTLSDITMDDLHQDATVVFTAANVIQSVKAVLAAFDGAFHGARDHRRFTVAGATFNVASNDPTYLDQAARALATRAQTDGRKCRIVVVNAGDHACPMPLWPAKHYPEREVEALLAGTPYRLHYFPELKFWQLFDTDRAVGIQWMTDKDGAPPWDSGSTLRNFVQWHLGCDTTSLLHGGTLAVSGAGILLAGEGGAGKSSTVLAGIFDGLQSVGDDYVLVDAQALTARPVFDTLKQDETGLRRLGQWGHAGISRVANWQGKYQFYMPDVVRSDLVASIALRAIVMPTLTHGTRTSFAQVSAKDAFLALAPSGVSQIHCDRSRLFAVAARVARTLPAYRLNLGTQPAEIVQEIRRFIQDFT
ncbi:hypothetical protein [Octadecabacter sp. R77987]|uniref:hypothetical protein n=1 Tax=Octadecabacter sp. R77987 TaxID=3093874 RepID=UPI003671A879